MDTRTGQIIDHDKFRKLMGDEKRHYVEMKNPPTPAQAKARKVGRNDPCPCGSSEKFKRCCYQPAQQGYTATNGATRHERRKSSALCRLAKKRGENIEEDKPCCVTAAI